MEVNYLLSCSQQQEYVTPGRVKGTHDSLVEMTWLTTNTHTKRHVMFITSIVETSGNCRKGHQWYRAAFIELAKGLAQGFYFSEVVERELNSVSRGLHDFNLIMTSKDKMMISYLISHVGQMKRRQQRPPVFRSKMKKIEYGYLLTYIYETWSNIEIKWPYVCADTRSTENEKNNYK